MGRGALWRLWGGAAPVWRGQLSLEHVCVLRVKRQPGADSSGPPRRCTRARGLTSARHLADHQVSTEGVRAGDPLRSLPGTQEFFRLNQPFLPPPPQFDPLTTFSSHLIPPPHPFPVRHVEPRLYAPCIYILYWMYFFNRSSLSLVTELSRYRCLLPTFYLSHSALLPLLL